MLGAGVGRVLVASSGLGLLALELPAARWSGWLWNEASADRGPVTAWLEKGEQHLYQECPSWRSQTFTRRTPMTMIIGIDPHKATHMVVAVDDDEQPVARFEVRADRGQAQRLLAWAEPLGAERTWAIESADGLGKLLSQELLAAGEHVVDVPSTLAARVRLLGSANAAKNDPNDALSIAIAGLRHGELRTVRRDDHATVLRLLAGRYDDLIALRTQAACRLHAVLRELVAGGAPRRLSASRASQLVRRVRPERPVEVERKRLAAD